MVLELAFFVATLVAFPKLALLLLLLVAEASLKFPSIVQGRLTQLSNKRQIISSRALESYRVPRTRKLYNIWKIVFTKYIWNQLNFRMNHNQFNKFWFIYSIKNLPSPTKQNYTVPTQVKYTVPHTSNCPAPSEHVTNERQIMPSPALESYHVPHTRKLSCPPH